MHWINTILFYFLWPTNRNLVRKENSGHCSLSKSVLFVNILLYFIPLLYYSIFNYKFCWFSKFPYQQKCTPFTCTKYDPWSWFLDFKQIFEKCHSYNAISESPYTETTCTLLPGGWTYFPEMKQFIFRKQKGMNVCKTKKQRARLLYLHNNIGCLNQFCRDQCNVVKPNIIPDYVE